MPSVGARLKAAMKALGSASAPSINYGGGPYGMHGIYGGFRPAIPSTTFDYRNAVGDLAQSDAIMICIQWIARTLPEAPIRVMRRTATGDEVVFGHRLTTLLDRPNPYYSGLMLWNGILTSLYASGNGYALKVRDALGRVAELWYIPHFFMVPRWYGNDFITYYEYGVPGGRQQLDPRDVIHFRYNLNPRNIRLGLTPFDTIYREIFTDNEAANYSAAILKNMGVPGVIISPADKDETISADEADQIKRSVAAHVSGDQRGQATVLSKAVTVTYPAIDPAKMNVRDLRRVPEERVAALVGLPPGVVGFGAGLERNTFSNYSASKEAAYETCLIPLHRMLAADLKAQLLEDEGIEGDAATEMVEFDTSHVRALEEDKTALYGRESLAWRSGIQKRGEARAAIGKEVRPEDDIYISDLPGFAPTGSGRSDPFQG